MTQCRFCKSDIPGDASRCPHCTSFLDGERPQGSPGQVTYIVDKDLVRFVQVAGAILALFFGIVLFGFGLDIKQLIKEIKDTTKEIEDTHFVSKKLDLDLKLAKIELDKETAAINEVVKDANATLSRIHESEEKAKQEGEEITERNRTTSILAASQGSSPQVSQPATSPAQLERLVDAKLLETLKDVLSPEQYLAIQAQIATKQRVALRRQVFDSKNTSDLPPAF